MSDEEILKKVIAKAVENGFDMAALPGGRFIQLRGPHLYKDKVPLYEFIFNHKFAKAFWGEYDSTHLDTLIHRSNPIAMGYLIEQRNQERKEFKGWQYHLQIMVLEKEPLLYLSKLI